MGAEVTACLHSLLLYVREAYLQDSTPMNKEWMGVQGWGGGSRKEGGKRGVEGKRGGGGRKRGR